MSALPIRWLPPPTVVALPLRCMPESLQRLLLEQSLNRVLDAALRDGGLDFLAYRHLALEVSDMRLRRVFTVRDRRLIDCGDRRSAEVAICGNAVELMLLAARREDPDTLFFQRRLVMQGDTELGLMVRNLLDRLDWEEFPAGVPYLLERLGDLADRLRRD